MCIRLRIVVLLFGAKPRDPSERLTCLSHSSTLAVDGHRLVRRAPLPGGTAVQVSCVPGAAVFRHRTALTRYQLSGPVKTLVERGQLLPGSTFLDYGCGLGADIRGLRDLGFNAFGWDPIHAPDGPRGEAEIVNLGYVLNVIEDPAERLETLAAAWHLARRLLVVSALIGDANADVPGTVALNDGILTRRSTFQKYFGQRELQCYIEDALETVAIPVAIGIFYIFRDPSEHQLFVQGRSRRHVDWDGLKLNCTKTKRLPQEPRAVRPPRPDRFAKHLPLLERFWSSVVALGRLPLPQGFSQSSELCAAFGSAKRALRHLLRHGRQEVFDRAQAARRSDLLVYLATSNLRKVIPFSCLPESIRADITVFFGSYKRGLVQGRDLLYCAADTDTVVLACDEAVVGWQDERSLCVLPSVVDRLPPVLRTLIACAELLYGDIRGADILKIHKFTGKVTFLNYADFETAPLPVLVKRTRVNLRTVQVDVFNHAADGQLLYFKERFLDTDDPEQQRLLSTSDLLRQLGISDSTLLGPRIPELRRIISEANRPNLAEDLGLVHAEDQVS